MDAPRHDGTLGGALRVLGAFDVRKHVLVAGMLASLAFPQSAHAQVDGILGIMDQIMREGARQQQITRERELRQQEIYRQHEAQLALIRRAQTALKELGFYTMAIDGQVGPGTRRAIGEYIRALRYPTDLSLKTTSRFWSATHKPGSDPSRRPARRRRAGSRHGATGRLRRRRGSQMPANGRPPAVKVSRITKPGVASGIRVLRVFVSSSRQGHAVSRRGGRWSRPSVPASKQRTIMPHSSNPARRIVRPSSGNARAWMRRAGPARHAWRRYPNVIGRVPPHCASRRLQSSGTTTP